MPDNEIESRDEKLLIIPLGEESKKITQVISNDTARRIIELLADSSLSATDISQHLNAPLTTITYTTCSYISPIIGTKQYNIQ